MSYGEHTRNPHEETEQDEHDNPVHCHFCDGYLGQYETITASDVVWFNGWPYCREHTPEPVRADLERSARMDIERDDFNITRR